MYSMLRLQSRFPLKFGTVTNVEGLPLPKLVVFALHPVKPIDSAELFGTFEGYMSHVSVSSKSVVTLFP